MHKNKQLMALALYGLAGIAQAGEKEELLKLRNTTTNLIMELVKQGILTQQVAEEMIKKAEQDAETQAQQMNAKQTTEKPEPGEVRVPYVPEFVKDEIREEVRKELRKDVVSDVVQTAKKEKWGTPDALPDWVNRFRLSGDLQLRSQSDLYPSDNATGFWANYRAINAAGGVTAAGLDAFLNTTHDRQRFRQRLRLAIDSKVADHLQAGIRLATGNIPDPVSTNQTLGNTGSQYQFNLDRAFLRYDAKNDGSFNWLTVSGGRIANPWFVGGDPLSGIGLSELVWDADLSFEGVAATVRHNLDGSAPLQPGGRPAHSVYATIGGFPLQEAALSARDKWLFGGQVGVDWGFENHDALGAGLAYYDYINLQARPNLNNPPTCNTNNAQNNLSVPQFLQFGNTMALICNDNNNALPGLFGLASDFRIINANINYNLLAYGPYHMILGADYAKNVGYNKQAVDRLTGRNLREQTDAWQVRVDLGWPTVNRAGHWSLFSLYKYVERDAVLDAFTDSNFHLGGSNAKGWVLGGNYGLMKNVWLSGTWLSTDVISGPKYSNDVLLVDLNTRF